MKIKILITVDVDAPAYAKEKGIEVSEVADNLAAEFENEGDGITWSVDSTESK